jgi:hypothetical protein
MHFVILSEAKNPLLLVLPIDMDNSKGKGSFAYGSG